MEYIKYNIVSMSYVSYKGLNIWDLRIQLFGISVSGIANAQ